MPLPPSRETSESRPARGRRLEGSYPRLPFSLFFCFFSFCFRFCFAFFLARGSNPEYDPGLLLLLGGDVERNPGPRCGVCARALRRGQTPLACALCGVLCHRQTACSGLTRAQQGVVRWRCRECVGGGGDGVGGALERALVVVESDVVGVETPVVSADGGAPRMGPCLSCGRGLRRGSVPLVCEGCGGRCHAIPRCSGVRRGHSWEGWRCSPCGGTPPSVGTGEVVAGRRVSTLGDRSSAVPRPARELCLVCGKLVRRCGHPLRCSVCHAACHKKCTSLSRDELARPNPSWVCGSCDPPAPPAATNAANTGGTASSTTNAEFMMRGCLRVMQWNADGVKLKADELGHFINTNRVDVCLVQESKLVSADRTPRFPGYTVVRQDRPSKGPGAARGGGLLTLVREDVPFRKLSPVRPSGGSALESLSIEVPVGGGDKLTIVNVYCPYDLYRIFTKGH